jgi:hypothetical protein
MGQHPPQSRSGDRRPGRHGVGGGGRERQPARPCRISPGPCPGGPAKHQGLREQPGGCRRHHDGPHGYPHIGLCESIPDRQTVPDLCTASVRSVGRADGSYGAVAVALTQAVAQAVEVSLTVEVSLAIAITLWISLALSFRINITVTVQDAVDATRPRRGSIIGLLRLACLLAGTGEVLSRAQRPGMVGAQQPFASGQIPLVQRDRLSWSARIPVRGGEVVP